MPTRLFFLGKKEEKFRFFIGLQTTTTTQLICRQAGTNVKIKKGKIYDSTIICRKNRFR